MQDRDWSGLIGMRQVIVVGARTNALLAETALHRGLNWRLAIFRDPDFRPNPHPRRNRRTFAASSATSNSTPKQTTGDDCPSRRFVQPGPPELYVVARM